MERDPVRFVWRAAPGLNAALILLAVASMPGIWLLLELVRAAVDDAAMGLAFAGGVGRARLLRLALQFPERIREEVFVVLPGVEFGRDAFGRAVLAGLAVLGLLAGVFMIVFDRLRTTVGRLSVEALGDRILAGIASAPVTEQGAAQRAAATASDLLVGQRRLLGSAVGSPVLSVAMLVAATLQVAAVDLRLLALVVGGFVLFALAGQLFASSRTALARADAASGEALRRAVTTLSANLSALAAHGTAAREQARVGNELAPSRRFAAQAEGRAVAVSGLLAALALCLPLGLLGAGAALGPSSGVSPGEAVAAAIAGTIGVGALATLVRWRRAVARTRPVFAEIARHLGTFHARRRDGRGLTLPSSGPLVAEGLVADGSLQGGRVGPLDLAVALPSHVALLGSATSGVRTVAGLLGGQMVARAGRLTLGGTDLGEVDAAARAARIAFAGGATLILAASLRQNLLYGCPDPEAPGTDDRLAASLSVAGLSETVYRRGLAGAVDARREPDLAARIVALRPVIRDALAGADLTALVQPFDPDRFGAQATLGENILFGVPLGDTFRDENLPAHPFMRALLDREGLTVPLVALGTAIVRSTLEMFSGLAPGSPIVGRFSLLSGPERDEFELIMSRQGQVRGAAANRDAGRLIGLALRYSEARHRLGLVGPDMETRILAVRRAFAAELPQPLAAAVEFFRPDRVCAATSLLDNLLFGRVALDRADAQGAVLGVLDGVVASEGLRADVLRIGLEARLDPEASGLSSAQAAAIDLVRCLVREPEILVVQRAADELPGPAGIALAGRLRAALAGRGLLMVLPGQAEAAATGFDRTIAFEAGRIQSDTGGEAPHA